MNCLIVEDEIVAAERLSSLIQSIESYSIILGITQSVRATVKWLKENAEPDLVFMDIQLADGLSFEIFENIDGNFPVIFTTAYDEYAIQAFKHNSIDYLLKPIQTSELKTAIEKYKKQQFTTVNNIPIYEKMLNTFTQRFKSKFVVKIGDHIRIIPVKDVQCFFSQDKAVFLQNKKGRDFDVNYTLDQIEELLDPDKFFRISRKYIVALDAISDIVSYANSRLEIKFSTGELEEVVVSRERVQEFKQWLER